MNHYDRRITQRSPMHAKGFALIGSEKHELSTHDISLGGSLIEFSTPFQTAPGEIVDLHLDLGFEARARVCRVAEKLGKTLIGFRFERLEFTPG